MTNAPTVGAIPITIKVNTSKKTKNIKAPATKVYTHAFTEPALTEFDFLVFPAIRIQPIIQYTPILIKAIIEKMSEKNAPISAPITFDNSGR